MGSLLPVANISCDVLVVGGGLGGVAAAMAAAENGLRVIICEETLWLGGQLTSQGVPPDEHPWIEKFGCTSRYRALRRTVRDLYIEKSPDLAALPDNFNPGGGWVSALCATPPMWHRAILHLLRPFIADGRLTVLLQTVLAGGSLLSGPPRKESESRPEIQADRITRVQLLNLRLNTEVSIFPTWVLDATELGDLIELSGAEFVVGSESVAMTCEQNADQVYRMQNQQAVTWAFAMEVRNDKSGLLERPAHYDRWRSFQPQFWPGPLFGMQDLDPLTNRPRNPSLPLFSSDWRNWFRYRQIVDPSVFSTPQGFPATLVNWPQNDYFSAPLIGTDCATRWLRLQEAKQLSRCFLYYLQTECPRPEGGTGYPELALSPSAMGTADGFALTPYIRESRRIVACETIVEGMVSAPTTIGNSVGVGSYRIDLHPSTGGDAYLDLATSPFQIPLGALVPIRLENLLPACKNLGSTHITNGCCRLHPVEWNVGESTGRLAAFCSQQGATPQQVFHSAVLTTGFQAVLQAAGVELEWPTEAMNR